MFLHKKNKKTVSKLVTSILIGIFSLAMVITLFSIYTLYHALDDAYKVNTAGALRMQAYQLALNVHASNKNKAKYIHQFEQNLSQLGENLLENNEAQKEVHFNYSQIQHKWQDIKIILLSDKAEQYLNSLDGFVENINRLVLLLQKKSETKIRNLAVVGGNGLAFILFFVLFLIYYTRFRIVAPLDQLLRASQKIKQGEFDIQLSIQHVNELSTLSEHFILMAKELRALYQEQEKKIAGKTSKLKKANDNLQALYHCANEFASAKIEKDNFVQMLNHLVNIDGISALKLKQTHPELAHWHISIGTQTTNAWNNITLKLDKMKLGELCWQGNKLEIEPELLTSVANILARGIDYLYSQQQTVNMAIIEERMHLARELHDSIAQSLSYLNIQVALLRRALDKTSKSNVLEITDNISNQLSVTYKQLRSLISEFRLQPTQDDFLFALNEMLDTLRKQSGLTIKLDKHLTAISLEKQSLMHVLLIVKEACTNAINHAKATEIEIQCEQENDLLSINIIDNGIGFNPAITADGHFGLKIMKERSQLLGGDLTLVSAPNQGSRISLTFTIS